jgi:hypothetical protein
VLRAAQYFKKIESNKTLIREMNSEIQAAQLQENGEDSSEGSSSEDEADLKTSEEMKKTLLVLEKLVSGNTEGVISGDSP